MLPAATSHRQTITEPASPILRTCSLAGRESSAITKWPIVVRMYGLLHYDPTNVWKLRSSMQTLIKFA